MFPITKGQDSILMTIRMTTSTTNGLLGVILAVYNMTASTVTKMVTTFSLLLYLLLYAEHLIIVVGVKIGSLWSDTTKYNKYDGHTQYNLFF